MPEPIQSCPCPRCGSFNTLLWRDDAGGVFMRQCLALACGHEWDKSPRCLAVESMTWADFERLNNRSQ